MRSRGGAEVLRTVGRYGLAYHDWFVYGDDERVMDLERKIHEILFPQIAYEYRDLAAAKGIGVGDELDHAWRNPRCDVLGVWSHIWYRCDVFVTADDVFHKPDKHAALIALGAKAIVRPQDVPAVAGTSSVARANIAGDSGKRGP